MRIKILLGLTILLSLSILLGCSKEKVIIEVPTTGPVAENGQLQVIGTQLCNENADPIWLRGMSSHGMQWYPDAINEESLSILANDWKCDVVRLSLYAREGGYSTNPEYFTQLMDEKIQLAIESGLYVVIDWHQLSPGNPNEDREDAIVYLSHMAERFGHLPHVIYEICNEPNECEWSEVKSYAEEVIPIIRRIDRDALIIVGTHGWGTFGLSDGRTEYDIIDNPVDAENILYSFHFYAASHSIDYYGPAIRNLAQHYPIFVTEFGTQTYSGDGANDFESTDAYLKMFEELQISWINWNFSYDRRSGAVLRSPTNYTDLKEAGVYIRENILNPPSSWD